MPRCRAPRSLLLAVLVLCGCVREVIEPEWPAKPKALDFESFDLRGELRSIGQPHGVNVIVELAAEDLPDKRARELFREDQYRPTIFVEPDGTETWRAGPHQVSFASGRLRAGPFVYTLADNAKLFLFKERVGDFTFQLHQQRIVLRAEGRWSPAIYYSIVDVLPDGTPFERGRAKSRTIVTYPVESLRIGARRITVDARTGGWKLDGQPYAPDPDRDLLLEGVLPFAEP
jgi:hypothetical protein